MYHLGFLGGGQLARMSIQAAQRMGLRCVVLDPSEDCCAGQIADHQIGDLGDIEAIARIARACDRITLENEFIPAQAIRGAFTSVGRDERALMPGIDTLATIQDKLKQREALQKAGVPCPNAAAIHDPDVLLSRLAEDADWAPVVLKSRFGGYDGKGVRPAHSLQQFASHLADLDAEVAKWLIEDLVPFRRELAVMVFIDSTTTGAFATMETVQSNHVCDLVYPGGVDASEIAIAAVEAVGGKGLFGVELFELDNGDLFVNEIAPRPHNTGHYTLDWGGTSQFEQHVRLAMGFPVDPHPSGAPTCMANLLAPASDQPFEIGKALNQALAHHRVHVHWYGKKLRPGRKVGHLNVVGVPNLVDSALAARLDFFGQVR